MASISGETNLNFKLPSLGDEISSVVEDVLRVHQIEQQTEPLKCVNCKLNPFVKFGEKKIVETDCQTDLSVSDYDKLKTENIILKKQIKYYQTALMHNISNPLVEQELE